jgi:mevalonate pyrophosphate decarboxylase
VIGLALAPWKVLAGGKLRTDAEEERRRQTGEKGRTLLNPDWERNEDEKKMAKALEEVAKQVGTEHITAGECDQDLAAGIGFIDSFERAQSLSRMCCRRRLTCSQLSEVARWNTCSPTSRHFPFPSRPNKSASSKM